MSSGKRFLVGFTGIAVVVAVLSVLRISQWFQFDNAMRSFGFPIEFAYVGEFGGPYHFDLLAAGVDAALGLALALVGGFWSAKVGERKRA